MLQDPAVTMWRSQRGVDTTEEHGTKYRNSMLQARRHAEKLALQTLLCLPFYTPVLSLV